MSKTGQTPPASDTGKSGGSGLPAFPGFNPADFERLFEINRNMMQNVLEINRGLFEFVDARFKADVATFDELCKCKDWQEASKVQTRFMSNLTQQYFDQTTKLMEAAAKILSTQRAGERD
jgi:hypothetical protein